MNSSASFVDNAYALRCELAGEVLRSSGRLQLRVTGHSMTPAVWPGDTLVVESANSSDICKGDIVLFSNGQRLVAHRLVARKFASENSIETQGDAVGRPDSPVAQSQLLGKVSFVLRNGKTIAPAKNLRFSQRAMASIFKRSDFAVRVAVGVHGLCRNSIVRS